MSVDDENAIFLREQLFRFSKQDVKILLLFVATQALPPTLYLRN